MMISGVMGRSVVWLGLLALSSHGAEWGVILSADVAGETLPCASCPTATALGGAARRSTYLQSHPEKFLKLDAGNVFFGPESLGDRGALAAEITAKLGYHAFNLSWRDFRFGMDHTRKLLADLDLPAVSCNLAETKTSRLLAPAYRIVDLGDKRLGVIGATYDPPARQTLPSLRTQLEGISILPVDESIAKAVAALLGEGVSDFVLLFYGPAPEGIRLAKRHGAVALGLGGRRGPDGGTPCPVLSVEKDRGQAVCLWESGADPRQQLLDRSIPDDPEIARLTEAEELAPSIAPEKPLRESGNATARAGSRSVGNRGLELTVESVAVGDTYGSEKPLGSEARFLVLDVNLKNRIEPELVFDRGVEEAITFHALRIQGAFLHWNGERVFALQERLQAQPGHLPDLFVLKYAGARQSGQLVFEVPAGEPDRGATLVVAHETFGTLEVELFGEAAGEPAPMEGLTRNADLHLKIGSFQAGKDEVVLELSGHGARRVKSPAAEDREHLLPINLSGLRLYLPGADPIKPESPAGALPIVFLPDRPATHVLRFAVPEPAEVLSLVLPVRPAAPSKEPYWIFALRGEKPSLANLNLRIPISAARPADPLADSPATENPPPVRGTVEKPKRDYTPPWPAPPELKPVYAERTAATEQRLSALDRRDDAAAVSPTLKPATPRKLSLGEPVSATFAKRTHRHYYLLEAPADLDLITDLVAVPTGDQPLRLTLYSSWPSEQVMGRIVGNALPELRVSQPLLLEVAPQSQEPPSYKLIWQETGRRVESGREFEPNRQAVIDLLPTMIPSGENSFELSGELHRGDRADFFVLETTQPALATLELRTARGGAVQFHTGAGRELVQSFSGPDRRLFLPDIHVLPGANLFSVDGAEGDYTVRATLYPAPGPEHEFEPNDQPDFAHRIYPGFNRRGRLPGSRDRDNYYFTWHGSGPVRIRAQAGEGGDLAVEIRRERIVVFTSERALRVDAVVELDAGHYDLLIRCQDPSLQSYELSLDHANPFREPTSEAQEAESTSPLRMRIEAERDTAAPFSFTPQRIAARLMIATTAARPSEVRLEVRSSHAGCIPVLERSTVTVPAGREVSIPLDLRIRRDAYAEGPIVITCAARTPESIATTEWKLTFPIGAEPTLQTWQDSPLPEELMGAFDFAHTGFGAHTIEPPKAATLFDGIAVGGAFRGSEALVDLAGEAPVSLSGCVLGLHGAAVARCVKDFEIAVSTDGATFHPVLNANTELRFDDQAFVFDKPVMASRARIRLLSGHYQDNPKELELGIVKLLGAKETATLFPRGANLADPKLGYHVVLAGPGELIAGFHHNRLAQIEGLRLERSTSVREEFLVRAEVSEVSPFGPWKRLGQFAAGSKGGAATALSSPVRARFLRLAGPWKKPTDLKVAEVVESETGPAYRSILAEWGGHGREAYFERTAAPRSAEPLNRPESSASSPIALRPGEPVEGVTWLELGWEDHYRLEVPANSGAVQLRLTGNPFVHARIEATGPDGELLATHSAPKPGGQEAVYSIRPLPEGPIRIRVHETPRHLAVMWDDSGSVARFVPGLHRMLRDFAFSINPEAERVQLTPLHRGPPGFLLDDWARDPYSIQQAIRFYQPTGSSESYKTLDFVLDELAKVDGNRALLIMTDEDGDRTTYAPRSIERKLAKVAPAVFSFHTFPGGGADPLHNRHIDHMQTWAEIGGGRYTMLRAPWELDTAISRVQAWLRRPAGYRLEMTAISSEPGFITVTAEAGETEDAKDTLAFGAGGVEVILDASGSMLKRMPGGQRRIDAAKAVLVDLVKAKLPERAPFALRVFGNREAGSCRTDLEIPFGPLQRTRALSTIRSLRAVNLAKTPIAKSLAAVPRDLADAEGKKIVVLITDGEETCDGDPQAVIGQLAAAGFEVEVNIIGFAIDDDALKAQFRAWSKLGGGDYFDATNSAQLSESLERSLQPMYEVVDPAGATVAIGRVNGPKVAAPAGSYLIRVKNGKGQDAAVEIEPGKESAVRLGP